MDDIDPLTAMWARWNHIQPSLFPWLREEVDPLTERLGRLVVVLDTIGLQAFVPAPSSGPRSPARGSARARQSLRRQGRARHTHYQRPHRTLGRRQVAPPHLGWERRAQVPSEATFSRAFAEF